jgi:hypothetical protein
MKTTVIIAGLSLVLLTACSQPLARGPSPRSNSPAVARFAVAQADGADDQPVSAGDRITIQTQLSRMTAPDAWYYTLDAVRPGPDDTLIVQATKHVTSIMGGDRGKRPVIGTFDRQTRLLTLQEDRRPDSGSSSHIPYSPDGVRCR